LRLIAQPHVSVKSTEIPVFPPCSRDTESSASTTPVKLGYFVKCYTKQPLDNRKIRVIYYSHHVGER
ncbi:MAG: hypothetical protein OXT74_17860, partial [Candidatus Poribacteria bacterium]|nr:hypothetical protein [Candidatus Poribacteria bacterium]